MRKDLPAVGTVELLELISDYVPDDFINQLLPRRRGVGIPVPEGHATLAQRFNVGEGAH
jgi:hypothetical protein